MQGAVVFFAGLLAFSQLGFAKPEYTRKTKLECEKCHPPNSRNLNDAGEYYRTHHYKMDGYKPKEEEKPSDKNGKDDKKQANHA